MFHGSPNVKRRRIEEQETFVLVIEAGWTARMEELAHGLKFVSHRSVAQRKLVIVVTVERFDIFLQDRVGGALPQESALSDSP